eukprot:Stramenopile-MAST_4_protein_4987
MRTVESVRAQDSAVIVHDPCSWGVGRRGKTTRTGAETGAGAAMPYFSLVPRTTWKATAPTDLSWRPDKTETTRHLIDPRHFQQKKVNDIKRKNVTHRVGLFYSRPDVGYYEAAPPTTNDSADAAGAEATEATSPGEQDHTGGSAMGEGLQDSSGKAYIHGQIVPTE